MHTHYARSSVCARYKNPFAMSGVGFVHVFFPCLEATGAMRLLARLDLLRWKRSRSRGQGENRAREPAYTLFRPPPAPVCLALRFFMLTSFSRPSLRLPPRFNPFQRGRSPSVKSGIFFSACIWNF